LAYFLNFFNFFNLVIVIVQLFVLLKPRHDLFDAYGAGYIGSHTCVALLEAGHTVIVADNLCNSKAETIDRIEQITNEKVTFYQIDVTDEKGLDTIFSNHKIDGIIHFAGLKAVGESVEKPLAYYYNNTVSTMILCQACQK
jgi:UDP-glucose 4-epimerase